MSHLAAALSEFMFDEFLRSVHFRPMQIPKPFNEVGEIDFQRLISASVVESETIDYKRTINVTQSKAKLEFLKDICSFLNSSGGDIIIGMEEENGRAKALVPLTNFNFERDIVMLRDLWRYHLDPEPVTIDARDVTITGGSILFIRVSRSWNAPHMVTFDNDNHFYVRDHAGKRSMSTTDLRHAFLLGDSAVGKMKAFVSERIDQLDTSFSFTSRSLLVAHVLPLVSFASTYSANLQAALGLGGFRTVPSPGGQRTGYNFEGVFAKTELSSGSTVSKLQLFRNGCLEFVDAHAISGDASASKTINVSVCGYLAKMVETAINLYKALSLPPPFFVVPTLTRMDGCLLDGRPDRRCEHYQLRLPEVMVSDYEAETIRIMAESFNVLYQAFGVANAPPIPSVLS